MMRRVIAWTAIGLLAGSTVAIAAVGRGTSMVSLQLSHGTADLYDPSGVSGGYISAYDHSELGFQGEYWMMMSDDYAVTVSAGYGFFSEKDQPGDAAAAGSPDHVYSQSSFMVNVGGDRVAKVGERAVVYFGPRVEYWGGKAKFEDFAVGVTDETETVGRISIGGRIGGIALVGPSWGVTGHIGHKIGYATAEQGGAKATWWPSSFDAAGGIIFLFGGAQ